LNKLSTPPTTIPGVTVGVWSRWLAIWGDPTGGTNSSPGFKVGPKEVNNCFYLHCGFCWWNFLTLIPF
jgi:hypothetical protein